MAEIIHEILECCIKFDQHRPHFKVLSYASVFLRYCRLLLLLSYKKQRAIFFFWGIHIFSKYRIHNFFHTHEKITLKATSRCAKRCAALKLNISLNDLAVKLRIHGRHPMMSYLSSLPIAALRSLDTEANRFYDRNHQMYDAALLTRCYTQHALRPFIDSESNHIRSFIKVPFINKGIDFIDLPSIFQDKSVIQSIPTYFQNSEPPIICYKYNKPIRNTIFNFNKLVSDLDIHANTPKS